MSRAQLSGLKPHRRNVTTDLGSDSEGKFPFLRLLLPPVPGVRAVLKSPGGPAARPAPARSGTVREPTPAAPTRAKRREARLKARLKAQLKAQPKAHLTGPSVGAHCHICSTLPSTFRQSRAATSASPTGTRPSTSCCGMSFTLRSAHRSLMLHTVLTQAGAACQQWEPHTDDPAHEAAEPSTPRQEDCA